MPAVYYPVSVLKFSLMSIFTFDLYLYYWFYRNWKFVRDQRNDPINVFWQTLFFPFTSYGLLRRIHEDLVAHKSEGRAVGASLFPSGLLAVLLFLAFSVGPNFFGDPYWLVSLLVFLLLVPPLRAINAMNGSTSFHLSRNSAIKIRHYIILAVGLPLLAFAVSASTGFMPPVSVVAGKDLFSWQKWAIRELTEIQPGERILYFYSDALLSYRVDSNVVTDRRLVSYYTDESGTEYLAAIEFDEILELHVLVGGYFDPTQIFACAVDGELLILYSSADRNEAPMLNEIKKRLPRDVPYILEDAVDFKCPDAKGA